MDISDPNSREQINRTFAYDEIRQQKNLIFLTVSYHLIS